MNFDSQKGIFPDCQLRLYDEFSQVAEEDAGQTYISSKFCELTLGSCIHFIPGEESVGIVFGILGQWIGTLNVPACTDDFSWTNDHDLGHVILLEDRKLRQLSYRQMASEYLARLSRLSPTDRQPQA
ncbi:hypothetical protein [Xanthomonas citri]|uniref:hypothetical protein n=1 Tax=Xanthomonas citri TaxID=346 RepID=UPI0018D553C0|nr:hypothetical protein [Xanthomonas citri]